MTPVISFTCFSNGRYKRDPKACTDCQPASRNELSRHWRVGRPQNGRVVSPEVRLRPGLLSTRNLRLLEYQQLHGELYVTSLSVFRHCAYEWWHFCRLNCPRNHFRVILHCYANTFWSDSYFSDQFITKIYTRIHTCNILYASFFRLQQRTLKSWPRWHLTVIARMTHM